MGRKQTSQERDVERTTLCALTGAAAPPSVAVLCRPSEELEEIGSDCNLECPAEESDFTKKISQRHQTDANY